VKNLILLYHKRTNTYWINDVNWVRKPRNELLKLKISCFETVDNNVFEVKRMMNKMGFERVKNEENPIILFKKFFNEFKTK
jgi:hypothetical protein